MSNRCCRYMCNVSIAVQDTCTLCLIAVEDTCILCLTAVVDTCTLCL